VVAKATERGQWCPCRCHTSTSSAAGSPARTSASPAAGPDWPENARAFGGSSQGSLGNYDPATSSLRTSQLSLIEDSTSSLRTLPRAGSMRNGTIYQRVSLWRPSPPGPHLARCLPQQRGSGRRRLRGWVAARLTRRGMRDAGTTRSDRTSSRIRWRRREPLGV